jgi:uncharacterized membrane protein YeaQ/YmgE (transglycosylase-associated protein family)
MVLNEDAEWEFGATQVAKQTDSERLREVAARFTRILSNREQLRRQQETKSVFDGRCRVRTLEFPHLPVRLDDVLKANAGGKSMFHLIWYVLIGLISGVIAKSVMHVHMTTFWTMVLGIIGSIIGGGVTHMFSRPTNERYHPAGLIFSTLGAILILFICYKLKIHFPQVNPF